MMTEQSNNSQAPDPFNFNIILFPVEYIALLNEKVYANNRIVTTDLVTVGSKQYVKLLFECAVGANSYMFRSNMPDYNQPVMFTFHIMGAQAKIDMIFLNNKPVIVMSRRIALVISDVVKYLSSTFYRNYLGCFRYESSSRMTKIDNFDGIFKIDFSGLRYSERQRLVRFVYKRTRTEPMNISLEEAIKSAKLLRKLDREVKEKKKKALSTAIPDSDEHFDVAGEMPLLNESFSATTAMPLTYSAGELIETEIRQAQRDSN